MKSDRSPSFDVKQICLLALLGSTMYVLKMVLAFLPNIEPISLLILTMAALLGWKGLWSVLVYVLLEYLTWGLQLWSISYLYVWPLLYGLAMVFRREKSRLVQASLAGLFGLAFGALCALPTLFLAGWQTAFSWWLAGVPFDLIHGLGNFVLVWLLLRPLEKLLAPLARRAGF